MVQTGQVSEAAAWRAWLLRAVYGDPSRLQILHGSAGNVRSRRASCRGWPDTPAQPRADR